MKQIKKRILAATLGLGLFTGIPVQAAMMSTSPKAAPAVAMEIAAMHNVKLTGEQTAAIAGLLGPYAVFMGTEPRDPLYHHHVMNYLHESGIIPMDGSCEHLMTME